MDWTVICLPIGDNEKERPKNTSGLAVILTNGDMQHEVTRVSFVRENSRHPSISFTDQLTEEIAKADEAALRMNELEEESQRLREIAEGEARGRIREILGQPSRSAKGA